MTTFGIDPGHNSPYDGGAVGIKSENSLILEVTRRVIPKLKTLGHVVIDCSPQQTVTSLRSSLRQRTNRANKYDVDVFVSIHFNAFNRQAHGTEVLYISSAGKRIAAPVVEEISKLGFTNRGLKYRNNLHVLRATKAPAILVECCFCDSARDMRLFDIEVEISQIMEESCFRPYIQVFDEFGFGLRIKARLLTRIYPFEAFLVKGKPLIEHEMKGKRRVKYNRTRSTFKMRLGMGTTTEQSGDMTITKAGGSGLCRMSFWQYVLTRVETGTLPKTEVAQKLIDYRDLLKNSPGKLKGKHLQSKLMSKTCNLLYTELVKSLIL